MSDLQYWIWFSSLRLLRFSVRRRLLEQFGGAKEIYFAEEDVLRKVEGLQQDELQALLNRDLEPSLAVLRRCEELGVNVITYQDAVYPERLRNIPDPPSVLYVKGRLPAVDAEPVITVVETRRCSEYGVKMARSVAYEISNRGGIVCTGLAGGIDSRAAEGALMAGGKVIGVLGTAINEVYPHWNTRLYEDVASSGALVSEYPPDQRGSRSNFPARNRIMAGLCVGVVVVEAPLRSGALITAHLALDYGRDVYAVPANADASGSRGSNNLLREGASLAENGWDALREYVQRFPGKIVCEGMRGVPDERAVPGDTVRAEQEAKRRRETQERRGFFKFRERGKASPEKKPGVGQTEFPAEDRSVEKSPAEDTTAAARPTLESQLAQLNEAQLGIVSVMTKPEMHLDDIVELSHLPSSTVVSELMMLELKGFVKQTLGKRYSLSLV